MVLVKCYISTCDESFASIDAVQAHFTMKHPACTYFICIIEGCNRSFNIWNSFRKHLRNKHAVPNRFNECNELFRQIDSVDHSCNVNEIYTDIYTDIDTVSDTEVLNNIPPDFHDLLEKHTNILVSKIYAKPGLPRNQVDSVIEDFSYFLGGNFLTILKQKVIDTLQNCHAKIEVISNIEKMFQSLSNPFNHLSTEYKRKIYFQSIGAYIPPESYNIDFRIGKKNTENGVKPQMTQVTGQCIPLRHVLKKFFELPDAFNNTIEYMQKVQSESDIIYNFVQCKRWKNVSTKYYQKSDIVFPLLVYYDDWEPNNPLGPHCEKIGAVYITIPSLPPECQSKLDNIFLALLFHADDRKQFGNKKTFSPLIKELIFLESEGIVINLIEGEKRIFFATGLLSGDNLGIHSMCGFVESFNANLICRFCKASKFLTETQCVEDPILLRSSENYYNDLALENPRLTGIKEECIFNKIPSVDIIEMPFVDSMHDCLEGVGHYSILPILKHFFQLDPLFLEMLNYRMYMFDYGSHDGLNKPPCITPEILNKNKLKMTASEMILFVRLFGIFVGDVIDENDEFWQLYLLLHDIFNIIQAKKLPSNIGDIFQVLIKEHNELYLRITGERLKPKHHFLLHYSMIFNYLGPFANVSCMRFEAMHKRLKAYCTASMSRKNLLLSLATKFQLALCYRFILQSSIFPSLMIGPGDIVDLCEFPQYSFFKSSLSDSLQVISKHFSVKWIEWKNFRYKLGLALIIGVDGSGDLRFARIEIILLHESKPLFICSPMINIGFNSHVRGYEVECDENNKWFCIKSSELIDYQPLHVYKMTNGEQYIVLKYFL